MTTAPDTGDRTGEPTPAGEAKPRWWRRPWVGPLLFIVIAFVAFSLPPYLSFDSSQSRVPAPEDAPLFFPALALHVVFGSVAIVTCCFQVWPRFRQRYPAAHRITGRVYVLAGVIPSGIFGLYVAWHTPFGPAARVSSLMLVGLWLAFTIAGIRMARQRRFVEHRRWMLRSFALTGSIIVNRVVGFVATISLWSQLDTTFGGSMQLLQFSAVGITTWLSWTSALLAVEWWLERGTASQRRARRRRAAATSAG